MRRFSRTKQCLNTLRNPTMTHTYGLHEFKSSAAFTNTLPPPSHHSYQPPLSLSIMSSDSTQIITSIRRRLGDLQTYQLPRLSECKGPIDLQRELSAELKEDIRRIKRSLDVCGASPWKVVVLIFGCRNWMRWRMSSRRRGRGRS